jgi:hypothetical protein
MFYNILFTCDKNALASFFNSGEGRLVFNFFVHVPGIYYSEGTHIIHFKFK